MSEKRGSNKYEDMELRRGPWTLEEDTLLIHYIACHGEGRWNLLAKCSGLKRTGKSCRLRWLNYLKPDIKRGNLSPEEQFLILELHSKWGNRWSRIAQHLPGRTDNEIKNYWRTRVQKQARQLKIDANSATFRDAIRCSWMPRLLEKIGSSQSMPPLIDSNAAATAGMIDQTPQGGRRPPQPFSDPAMQYPFENCSSYEPSGSDNHSPSTSSGSMALPQLPYLSDFSSNPANSYNGLIFDPFMGGHCIDHNGYGLDTMDPAPASASQLGSSVSDHNYTMAANNCVDNIGGDGLWNMDELWYICKKAT